MLRLFCVFCLATLIPVPQAFAQQDLICRKAKNTTRHYSIVVENAETGLPCSVVDRTNWKTPKVLWQAEYERTYCQNKIRDLVKRLKAQDWACTATNDRAGLRPVM